MSNPKIPHVSLNDTFNRHRTRFNQLIDSVGDLGLLETDVTSTVVGSINSVDSNLGERLDLTTINKTDIVAAVNEHDAELGTITPAAMGTTASTVSTAIAELDGRLDSINTNELITPRVYAQDSSAVNYFNGNVQLQSTLDVQGNVELQSDLDVQGNVQIDGTLTVDGVVSFKAGSAGSVALGDTNTDNVVFNADVNSHIIPNTDDTYDLGSASQEWRHAYIDGTANIDNVAADSATIGTLKVTDLTNNRLVIAGASGEVEDDANLTFDGSELTVGSTSIRTDAVGINTTGIEADSATVTGDLDVQGVTTLDETTVDGTLAATGTATFNSNVVVENDLRVEDSATITGNLRVVGNVTSDSRAFYIQADSAGTDQVNFGETVRVRGGEGIDVNRDGSNGWHVVAEKATSSNLGAAKFTTDNFTVTDGNVIIKDGGVANVELANSTITFADSNSNTAIALGSTVTFKGAPNEIEVNHVGSTFNIGLPTDVDIDGNLTIGDNFTVGGDLIIAGTSKIAGQFTEYLSEILPDATPTQDAGITVNRGNQDSAEFIWDEGNNQWEIGVIGNRERVVYDNGPADLTQVDMDSARVSGDMSIGGSLVLSGDLTVDGTTTTLNTQTVEIEDNVLLVNSNASGVPASSLRSGLEVERGSSTNVNLQWNELGDYWEAAYDGSNSKAEIFTHNNTTTDLGEGTNLYHTTARARGAIGAGGNGINYSSATGIITHKDTSEQSSSNNSGRTYIQDVGLDSFGHVTSLATASETVVDTNQLTVWSIEDSDGTEKSVSHGKELKILGDNNHITTNFGAGTGTDADPYDLKISHTLTSASGATIGGSVSSGGSFAAVTGITFDDAGHIDSVQTTDFDIFSNTNTQYTAGDGLDLVGTVFSHSNTSSASSQNNSGRTYIQDITVDTYGHITAMATGTETVTDTTYILDAATSSSGAIIRLDPSTGSNMDILLNEGNGIGIARDSNNQITISNTGIGTTYDLKAIAHGGHAVIRLDPSTGTNDDIKLIGGHNMTITRDSDTGITFDAATFSAGTGLTLTGTEYKITDGGVDSAQLANDAVDGTKIADNAINSEHYTDGSIDAAHLASNSVTQAKLADDAVGSNELDNVVTFLVKNSAGTTLKTLYGAGS